jgi:iron uptake system EfeUOB component EfeO/EfeM
MPSTLLHAPTAAPTGRRARGKILAGALALALIALVAAAAAPGGGDSRTVVGRPDVARGATHQQLLGVRLTHVFGSDIPASRYGRYIAQLEAGVNASGQFVSDLDPIAPQRLAAPEDDYRAYAERWAVRIARRVDLLGQAIASGERPRAEQDWENAWSAYLHLGAVYGLLGPLDTRIDGMPGLLGSTPPHFAGLHRIEMGLWTGARLPALTRWIGPLKRAVARLPHAIATVPITPLDYVLRGHEILEDAQRDMVSGLDVPWSGQGVLGLVAGVAATREVIKTLTPLLRGRDNTLIEVDNELLVLQTALAKIRSAHGGKWPSLSALTLTQREALDGTLAGTLSALSQIPGTLETAAVKPFPKLP